MRELNGRPPYPLPRARAVARGRSPHLSRLAGGEVEFARSSRKFRVRGPLHEAELWGESEFVEAPPHPDLLPASGEREKGRRTTCDRPALAAEGKEGAPRRPGRFSRR